MNRRPKLTLVVPGASPEDAAAVVAAIERFMRETAPRPRTTATPPNPWIRAARLAGVQRTAAGGTEDGGARGGPNHWGDGLPSGR